MNTKVAIVGLVIATSILVQSQEVDATLYQINSSTSSYTYLVPPEGTGMAGCRPDDFHCLFGVSGTLEFDVDPVASAGSFIGADLQMVGNTGTSAGAGFPVSVADGVESFLVNSIGSFPLQSSMAGTQEFYQPQSLFNTLLVTVSGNNLLFTGAYDFTYADGGGRVFQIEATAVPEPAVGSLTAIVAALSSVRRRTSIAAIYQR